MHKQYRIFYDFNGMTRGAPLHTKLSTDQVITNILRLPIELRSMLGDENATTSISTLSSKKGEGLLTIQTKDTESDMVKMLEHALSGLSLFGQEKEITSTSCSSSITKIVT